MLLQILDLLLLVLMQVHGLIIQVEFIQDVTLNQILILIML